MPLVAATLLAALVAAGCGGGKKEPNNIPQSGVRVTTTTASTTTTTAAGAAASAAGPLKIVVTNDDGVGAPGINALVTALAKVEGVQVTVVAPATQESGTGGQSTQGTLTTQPAKLSGGGAATAVQGFPADTIRVALEDMKLKPDLVISGINAGQNLGPVVDISGTVGAARAAVKAGVPALAVSQGTAKTVDYNVAADMVVKWLQDNRAAITGHKLPTNSVLNLNVPSCETGQVRGSVDVASGTTGNPVAPANCSATGTGFKDDVTAFANGFATFTHVPVAPATA